MQKGDHLDPVIGARTKTTSASMIKTEEVAASRPTPGPLMEPLALPNPHLDRPRRVPRPRSDLIWQKHPSLVNPYHARVYAAASRRCTTTCRSIQVGTGWSSLYDSGRWPVADFNAAYSSPAYECT
jgi:hypothetical protein